MIANRNFFLIVLQPEIYFNLLTILYILKVLGIGKITVLGVEYETNCIFYRILKVLI